MSAPMAGTAPTTLYTTSAPPRPHHHVRDKDDLLTQLLDEYAELPQLAALADRWASLTSRDTYTIGLRSLVDGFLRALPRPD
ncbi:hypothetical protein [Candidatus Frankia alpina]|uniref:hypothetical protein n=1 Tax=Candidatus Frankia alpina TaxID=2699483 RepID=UPI001A97E439|nr:hypothetical protein [Candidatus Frankia alpina]